MTWLLAVIGAITAFFKATNVAIQALIFGWAKKAGRVEAERDALDEAAKSAEQRKRVDDEISRMDRAAIDQRLRRWTRQ